MKNVVGLIALFGSARHTAQAVTEAGRLDRKSSFQLTSPHQIDPWSTSAWCCYKVESVHWCFFKGGWGPKIKGAKGQRVAKRRLEFKGAKGQMRREAAGFLKIHVFKGAVGPPLLENPWKKKTPMGSALTKKRTTSMDIHQLFPPLQVPPA